MAGTCNSRYMIPRLERHGKERIDDTSLTMIRLYIPHFTCTVHVMCMLYIHYLIENDTTTTSIIS
jgi:hypothetical protein